MVGDWRLLTAELGVPELWGAYDRAIPKYDMPAPGRSERATSSGEVIAPVGGRTFSSFLLAHDGDALALIVSVTQVFEVG